jgi:5-methyltetrahydrofolate--homocysteine methyltransferase
MTPAASVSGIYLAHPEARYFSVGRLGRDQVEDYAGRQGVSTAEAERRLRPNLAYEPQEPKKPGEPAVAPAGTAAGSRGSGR